ncbi:retrotransposon protein, putative, ty1-copia subclass [Tanacetum coccineum]
MLQDVKSYLRKCFARKDLGEAPYVLGIKLYRDISRRLIGLCQSAYIKKILKRFHMENSKRGSIPMQDKPKLCKSQDASTPAEVKRKEFLMPRLIHGNSYWTVVKNILKYLCNTKDMFLVYGGDIKRELRVAFYTNAGYLTDVDDTNILATTCEEAEYIVALDTSKEDVWIRKFIYGFSVLPINEVPMKMYSDNTEAITIANEPVITKGARHYRAKVHYLREFIEFDDI